MKIQDYARLGDIAGVFAELDRGVDIESRDEVQSYTPLMWAIVSPDAGTGLVRLLIERGADIEAVHKRRADSPEWSVLHLSILAGNREKTAALLNAGLDLHYTQGRPYDALRQAIPPEDDPATPDRIDFVQFLLDRGARINPKEDEYQTALELASERDQFAIAGLLLKNGADAAELGWTELMFAVVFGTLQQVEHLLRNGADLTARDEYERSAWHLCIATGDITKCELLLSHVADRNSPGGEFNTPPLFYAIDYGHMPLLGWLLDQGVDINAQNKYQETPLMHAVEKNSIEAVRILLAAGADLNLVDYTYSSAMDKVMVPEILDVFLEAGGDLNDASTGMRRVLLGLDKPMPWPVSKQQRFLQGRAKAEPWTISKEEYERDKRHRFGTANPERINIEFWNAMVRSGASSDGVCVYYDDFNFEQRPVWTYNRFGKSITALPDGRYIEIAGENEDSYDPNFCIYNDVFVHYGNGRFEIFGYPKEVFPPTDFHSATLVDDWIYIVGCTGYVDQRVPGETPVYRLNVDTYVIEKVETTGDNPGWISEHRAELEDRELIIYWGQIYSLSLDNGQQTYKDNTETFVLDLETLVWSRAERGSPTN